MLLKNSVREPRWGHISKEDYEKWKDKKYIPGQLIWLQNKTDRSEYEEAVYKKLKEKYGTGRTDVE